MELKILFRNYNTAAIIRLRSAGTLSIVYDRAESTWLFGGSDDTITSGVLANPILARLERN